MSVNKWILTNMYWISSREQSPSCGGAYGLNVIVLENDSIARQFVDIWSFYFRTMKTHITPAEVVNKNEQNIRLWWRWGDQCAKICQVKKNENALARLHNRLHNLLNPLNHSVTPSVVAQSRDPYEVYNWPNETGSHMISMMSCKSERIYHQYSSRSIIDGPLARIWTRFTTPWLTAILISIAQSLLMPSGRTSVAP